MLYVEEIASSKILPELFTNTVLTNNSVTGSPYIYISTIFCKGGCAYVQNNGLAWYYKTGAKYTNLSGQTVVLANAVSEIVTAYGTETFTCNRIVKDITLTGAYSRSNIAYTPTYYPDAYYQVLSLP